MADQLLHFADTVLIDAPRAAVWELLQDPFAIGSCVPGLEEVELLEGGTIFGGVATLNFGSSELRLPTRLQWVEKQPLLGGRVAGQTTVSGHIISVDGSLNLADATPGTQLSWQTTVALPEELQDNQLLIQLARSLALRFINNFFDCLRAGLDTI